MSLVWQKDKASSSVREGATALASVFSWKEALFSGQEEALAMWPLPEGIYRSLAWGEALVAANDESGGRDIKIIKGQ